MNRLEAEKIKLDQMAPYSMAELIQRNQDLKLMIVDEMREYGGSFVQALAECIVRADQSNLQTLLLSFPVYIYQYQPSKWLTPKKPELERK